MALKTLVIGLCVTVLLILYIVGLYLLMSRTDPPPGWTCDDVTDAQRNSKNPLLIYWSKAAIKIYDVCNKSKSLLPIFSNSIIGTFMDATHIHWYTNTTDFTGIYRAFTNGSSKEVIALAGIGTIDKIEVDWITGNIYFMDSLYDRIGVCTKSASHCTSIITVDELRGFALYPVNGEMYVISWKPVPQIFRSGMNGKSQVTVVNNDLERPKCLTIDHPASRLYWIDEKKEIIESVKLDGSDRKKVLLILATRLSAIAVFNNRLLFNDIETGSIFYDDQPNGVTEGRLIDDYGIIDMHIHNPKIGHDFHNPCNDTPCGEICLLTAGHNYTCACSSKKILGNDGESCVLIEDMENQHLVIAAGRNFYDYHHDFLGKPQLNRINDSHDFGKVYNSIKQNLTKRDNEEIYNQFQRFLYGGVQSVAYDFIGHNLYMANPRENRIEVMSLTTLETSFFQHTKYAPRSILLMPEWSRMIVGLCDTKSCSLDEMSMTEDEWNLLLDQPVLQQTHDVPLAFDPKSRKVFWADEVGGKIKSMAIGSRGHGEKVEVDGLKCPVSVAVLDDDIFWTQRYSKRIYWARRTMHSITRTRFDVRIPGDIDVIHLITPSTNYYKKQESGNIHTCRIGNGGCSHVCAIHRIHSRLCKCPAHMYLYSVPYEICQI